MKWLAAVAIVGILACGRHPLARLAETQERVVQQVREKQDQAALVSRAVWRLVTVDGRDRLVQLLAAAVNP